MVLIFGRILLITCSMHGCMVNRQSINDPSNLKSSPWPREGCNILKDSLLGATEEGALFCYELFHHNLPWRSRMFWDDFGRKAARLSSLFYSQKQYEHSTMLQWLVSDGNSGQTMATCAVLLIWRTNDTRTGALGEETFTAWDENA